MAYGEDAECLECLGTSKTDDSVDWVMELVVKNRFPVHEVAEMLLGI
jgi:disulfide oxidoreductase YuzD